MMANPIPVPMDALGIDPKLVVDFFASFSRFEYALKRSGHLKRPQPQSAAAERPPSGARSSRNAEPDWDDFANSVSGKFAGVTEQSFRDAVDFFLRKPPERKIVVDDELQFEAIRRGQGESEEQYVLRLVRCVRNNLFHGGKFPTGPVEEVARNSKLLNACLAVLESCLELSPNLKQTFCEFAEADSSKIERRVRSAVDVLGVAQADALKAYGDLVIYGICMSLEADGWHVDYELRDARWKGGGPHYVIDATTAAILSKTYEQ